jgi:hypothetical protein
MKQEVLILIQHGTWKLWSKHGTCVKVM